MRSGASFLIGPYALVMRRLLLFTLLLAALAVAPRPLHGQVDATLDEAAPAASTLFVKSRLGLTQYTGENSPLLLAGTCSGSALGCPGAAYGLGLEAGVRLTPAIGASLAFQTASYRSVAALDAMPDRARDYRIRKTMQLLTQYRFADLSAYVAPYLQAGMHVTTGHTPLQNTVPGGTDAVHVVERWSFGPSFTAGVDISLSRHLAVFAEVTTNVAMPDDAVDGHGGFIGIDRLSWAGVGLQLQNVALPFALRPDAASPTAAAQPANSTASAPSALAVNEMGRFEITPAADAPASRRYTWRFSDGTVREGRLVTKQFDAPGTYRAAVRPAQAAADAEPLHTFRVRIRPAPAPLRIDRIAVAPDTLRPDEPVVFSPVLHSGTPVEYRWTLGDGAVAFTREPIYTYTEPGTYEVTLEVASSTGRATTSRTITVAAPRPATPPARARIVTYRIQVGAFSNRARAQAFAEQSATELPKPPEVYHDPSSGYHRVALPYATEQAARSALRALRAQSAFADAFLQRVDDSASAGS